MPKRFTATEIWEEDWFLDMPYEYKLFWFYLLSNCDHAGLFKVNLRSFCGLNGVNLTSNKALEYFNNGKDRIRVINSTLWLIEDFFVYQYGSVFNMNNRVHESIFNLYQRQKIELTSIRGLTDLKDRVKDKDKDKDKDNKVIDKKIRGKKFKEDGSSVLLENDKWQPLGLNQKSLLEIGELDPKDVYLGYIN